MAERCGGARPRPGEAVAATAFSLPDAAGRAAARERHAASARRQAALRAYVDAAGVRGAAEESVAVDKLHAAPDGDPRSYWSIGTYWHPDPAAPGGAPYVRRDGEHNPLALDPRSDLQKMRRLAVRAQAGAMAWFFDGDAEAADRAAGALWAWFVDPATRMNPHLRYAQAIPGVCEGRGIGLIDTTALFGAANAADLLADRAPDMAAGVRAWFGEYLDWMLDSDHGREERGWFNNHAVWYEAQIARFGALAGRADSVADAAARLAAHAAAQVAGDGSMPHELARTRSWMYSNFTAAGFLAGGFAARAAGVVLDPAAWAPARRAVDFLAPFAAGAKAWTHPQLDGVDAAAFRPVAAQAAAWWPDGGYAAALAALPPGRGDAVEFFYP